MRAQFPVTQSCLYLDSAHQAPLASSVRQAMVDFLDEGLLHAGPKKLWLSRIPAIRARVARLLGASAEEITFTRNTSEGLNAAANAIDWRPGDSVLMLAGDHPNNSYAWLNLQRRGVRVRFIEAGDARVDAGTFLPHLEPGTRAISLSHVSSDTGRRCDLASIGAMCKTQGMLLVVDAIQSLGSFPVDVHAMGISMLASGCHKGLLVPQGLGLLYVDRSLSGLWPGYLAMAGVLDPPADRRIDLEQMVLRPAAGRFELGNLSLPHLHGLDAALALIERIGVEAIAQHLQALGERLRGHMDRLGVRLISPREPQQASHIHMLDLPGAQWGEYLAAQGVRVSPQRLGIRVSLAMFNSPQEVDRLAGIIAQRLP